MPRSNPYLVFTLRSREFFESLDSYEPSPELVSIVESYADHSWNVRSLGFWAYCRPADWTPARQGWKIHVSAVHWTAEETLHAVVPLLVRERICFKFCSDLRMVKLSTGKNWPRTGSGKFMTIYPKDQPDFLRLAAALHRATQDLRGPYILSDRPYPGSRVIFYRYGEHASPVRVDAAGQGMHTLVRPDGVGVPDERMPYFCLPPWIIDPLDKTGTVATPRVVMLKDRYRVVNALRYSSNGGIYDAVDTATGHQVVIREARPMFGAQDGQGDARTLLKKEARILQKLESTGLSARFVDLFEEWEHLFLVQEKFEAQTLWLYAISSWARGGYSPSTLLAPAELSGIISRTIRKLARGLQTIHSHGIILRDLTKTNVLVTTSGEVKFIDFELAYEIDRDDAPVFGFTFGYASPQQLAQERPRFEDDYYALGALILDIISFNASGHPLNPAGVMRTLELTLQDLGLPREFCEIVTGLTAPEVGDRWRLHDVATTLDRASEAPMLRRNGVERAALPHRAAPSPCVIADVAGTVEGISRYILNAADIEREDRLWPASPETFTTNPLGLQFGASGIAHYLLQAAGSVPSPIVDWIRKGLTRFLCPPSLYNGRSGIALFLLEVGLETVARDLMETAATQHELITEDPSLYYGAAGWGLANLHFWKKTNDDRYVERAIAIGNHLVQTSTVTPEGVCWNHNGTINYGLGHGQSGIATFLIYLNAAKPNASFRETAVQAIDYDCAHAFERDNLLLWYQHSGVKAGQALPHVRFGTAGVGAAALRCYVATREPRFRRIAEECARSVATRHANKLWQDFGLAGYGELLLDMYAFLGDEQYLNSAYYVATGILPNRIPRLDGFAFAGQEQLRISCDIGMGAAGIGLFLHRVLHPALPRMLFLDGMLDAVVNNQGTAPTSSDGRKSGPGDHIDRIGV